MSFLQSRQSLIRTTAQVAAAVGVMHYLVNPTLDKLILPKEDFDFDTDTAKKDTTARTTTLPFDPSQTDILQYPHFQFVKSHKVKWPPQLPLREHFIGPSSLLQALIPPWLAYLGGIPDTEKAIKQELMEPQSVNILDARKHASLDFAHTGFTLLRSPPRRQQDGSTKNDKTRSIDWRSESDIYEHFCKPFLEPRLLQLYPGATRIQFTRTVVRGGNRWGDQRPTVDGPHLDFGQDDALRRAFHDEFPTNTVEQQALTEQLDTDTEEVRVVVGIWKPIHMGDDNTAVVYDRPLAVMDASTFDAQHEVPFHLHFSLGGFAMHLLTSVIAHDTRQQWFYYPYQRQDEVLVFTQYTKGRHFCNPHTSFLVPNRPKSYTPRQSIEMRAAVFYPKETNAEWIVTTE